MIVYGKIGTGPRKELRIKGRKRNLFIGEEVYFVDTCELKQNGKAALPRMWKQARIWKLEGDMVFLTLC